MIKQVLSSIPHCQTSCSFVISTKTFKVSHHFIPYLSGFPSSITHVKQLALLYTAVFIYIHHTTLSMQPSLLHSIADFSNTQYSLNTWPPILSEHAPICSYSGYYAFRTFSHLITQVTETDYNIFPMRPAIYNVYFLC